jgi:DNA invertase Pin-like site-specific DNA recombinase
VRVFESKEILIEKVFIYKVVDKSLSPHERMSINQKLLKFINQNAIEIIEIYEDNVNTPPSKREGLKKVLTAYEEYFNNSYGQRIDNIMSILGIKILIATDINRLGANTLDSMEVLETLTKNSQVLFI